MSLLASCALLIFTLLLFFVTFEFQNECLAYLQYHIRGYIHRLILIFWMDSWRHSIPHALDLFIDLSIGGCIGLVNMLAVINLSCKVVRVIRECPWIREFICPVVSFFLSDFIFIMRIVIRVTSSDWLAYDLIILRIDIRLNLEPLKLFLKHLTLQSFLLELSFIILVYFQTHL